MHIAFWGSSLVSAYWNGAATYYRGILRALAQQGHRITFYEPDAYNRQQHRDIPDPDWAKIVVYNHSDANEVAGHLQRSGSADVVVKASGVGVLDEYLERRISTLSNTCKVFWDVDAPATLDRLRASATDPFHSALREFALVLTYGGGAPVTTSYLELGAKDCVPIYNAFDPDIHFPVQRDERFACDLSFLGNRLPDREKRVEEFLLRAAVLCPSSRLILGGSGWADKVLPSNISYIGHVYTRDHNAFNCSARAVLNISRDSMARYGFSPATRVFEAAGAAACIITDEWEGIEKVLARDREILVARDGAEVASLLASLNRDRAQAIGHAAQKRVRSEHTYTQRGKLVEALLEQTLAKLQPAEALS